MSVQRFYKYSDIPGSELFLQRIPVFATQNYADYLNEFKGHDTTWFVKLENNTVSYLLPFAIKKKLIYSKGYFLTGVLFFDPAYTQDKEKKFIEDVVLFIKKNKLCDWIQQGSNWALFNTFPADSKAVRFGTYRITLKHRNEAELFKLIQKRSRQDINNAIKNGIKIKKGQNYLNDCLSVINSTAKEGNLQSLSLIESEKLLFYFKENCKIYVSYKDDIAQSATIFLSNEYCTYALFAGSINKLSRGSNTYLFWEAIRDAKQNNCYYFDFVGARINPIPGSKQERIQRFKEHFGCELVTGYLWKMNISFIKYYTYSTLLGLWFFSKRKKHIGDIIDQELKNTITSNNLNKIKNKENYDN